MTGFFRMPAMAAAASSTEVSKSSVETISLFPSSALARLEAGVPSATSSESSLEERFPIEEPLRINTGRAISFTGEAPPYLK